MEKFYVTLLLVIVLMGIAVLFVMLSDGSRTVSGKASQAVVADLEKQGVSGDGLNYCTTSSGTVYVTRDLCV